MSPLPLRNWIDLRSGKEKKRCQVLRYHGTRKSNSVYDEYNMAMRVMCALS